MALHLEEISLAVVPGAHALVLLDQAGWHVSKKSAPSTDGAPSWLETLVNAEGASPGSHRRLDSPRAVALQKRVDDRRVLSGSSTRSNAFAEYRYRGAHPARGTYRGRQRPI
jgi:hypothetical protein